MFEGKLTSVLNKLLGEYVHGISAKDLSVAVFKGDVVLKNLRLKTEALNALDLPFAVRSGLVGKLSLQIPWRALGKQPVVATIERLYVVAGFADDVDGTDALTVEERTERWERAKAELRRRTVDEGESKWLESSYPRRRRTKRRWTETRTSTRRAATGGSRGCWTPSSGTWR